MQYRREIDGLRAVAVVPVILFHAGFSVFSGGFVGVDVFFVISGYLISRIIIDELAQGEFSVARFYERRARRILPALFFVMLCCIPFAWVWMLPDQFRDFAKSLIAVTFFASNFKFWRESGYFESAAEEKPLLHTWSLAVEEQYYVVFPLFLLLVWRFGRSPAFYSIVIISVISLALSEWGYRKAPVANFYLAPTRAWELLAGSICAFLPLRRVQKSHGALSAVGLSLIVVSIFYFDESTPFPSFYALVPVGGTALIILFGAKGTWAAKLLSTNIFVGVGLVSYSAYLWHQPLFAFARIRSIGVPAQWLMLLLALASILLAFLSWRFIERPFRRNTAQMLPTMKGMSFGAVVTAFFFVVFGIIGLVTNGFQNRVGEDILELARFSEDRNSKFKACLPDYKTFSVEVAVKKCSNDMVGSGKYILIGDSHAGQYAEPLSDLLQAASKRFLQFTVSACPPIFGLIADGRNCNSYFSQIERYVDNEEIDAIIISSRWTMYATAIRFDNKEGGHEAGSLPAFRVTGMTAGSTEYEKALVAKFTAGIQYWLIKGIPIILIYPTPEAGWNVPKQLSKIAFFGNNNFDQGLSTSYKLFLNRNKSVIEAFDAIDHDNLFRVRPDEILCNTFVLERCANSFRNEIYYIDDDHLSFKGGGLIAKSILEEINSADNLISPTNR